MVDLVAAAGLIFDVLHEEVISEQVGCCWPAKLVSYINSGLDSPQGIEMNSLGRGGNTPDYIFSVKYPKAL